MQHFLVRLAVAACGAGLGLHAARRLAVVASGLHWVCLMKCSEWVVPGCVWAVYPPFTVCVLFLLGAGSAARAAGTREAPSDGQNPKP